MQPEAWRLRRAAINLFPGYPNEGTRATPRMAELKAALKDSATEGRSSGQWCKLHDCHQDDPKHPYSYPECEGHLRPATAVEEAALEDSATDTRAVPGEENGLLSDEEHRAHFAEDELRRRASIRSGSTRREQVAHWRPPRTQLRRRGSEADTDALQNGRAVLNGRSVIYRCRAYGV